jgi:TonB family protein
VLISKHEPKYSPEALKAKLQGTIRLSLVVGMDGVPQDVKVLRGLGLGLDEKAVEAVQGWRFKPATRGGEPVAVTAQVEVNFQIP